MRQCPVTITLLSFVTLHLHVMRRVCVAYGQGRVCVQLCRCLCMCLICVSVYVWPPHRLTGWPFLACLNSWIDLHCWIFCNKNVLNFKESLLRLMCEYSVWRGDKNEAWKKYPRGETKTSIYTFVFDSIAPLFILFLLLFHKVFCLESFCLDGTDLALCLSGFLAWCCPVVPVSRSVTDPKIGQFLW